MTVFLVIQAVLTALTFLYAIYGTYERNRPSNIWSVIWSRGAGLMLRSKQ